MRGSCEDFQLDQANGSHSFNSLPTEDTMASGDRTCLRVVGYGEVPHLSIGDTSLKLEGLLPPLQRLLPRQLAVPEFERK